MASDFLSNTRALRNVGFVRGFELAKLSGGRRERNSAQRNLRRDASLAVSLPPPRLTTFGTVDKSVDINQLCLSSPLFSLLAISSEGRQDIRYVSASTIAS